MAAGSSDVGTREGRDAPAARLTAGVRFGESPDSGAEARRLPLNLNASRRGSGAEDRIRSRS